MTICSSAAPSRSASRGELFAEFIEIERGRKNDRPLSSMPLPFADKGRSGRR